MIGAKKEEDAKTSTAGLAPLLDNGYWRQSRKDGLLFQATLGTLGQVLNWDWCFKIYRFILKFF